MAAAAILDFKNFKFLTVGTVKTVEVLHLAKFRQNRSNHGWNMAIFLFLKMAAATIFTFRNFKFLTPGRSKGLKYVTTPNFVEIGQNAAEISRFIDFSRWLRRHLGFQKFQIFNGRGGREGRTASSCQISSKSLETRPRYVSFNIMLVWLENAYSRPFLGSFWGTFPPNDVTHRPNPKKDHPGAEPRHLSHKARISVAWFDMGAYLWRSPHWSDVHENLCSGWWSRRNHVCQVSKWNFQGLQFYRGSNFPFFLLILNRPYNSAALLRCLW